MEKKKENFTSQKKYSHRQQFIRVEREWGEEGTIDSNLMCGTTQKIIVRRRSLPIFNINKKQN